MKTSVGVVFTATTLSFCGVAQAGVAILDPIGGDVVINSAPVAGVFESGSPTLTDLDLLRLHQSVNASLGSNATDGFVTFLLVDTNDGLAFVSLVDEFTGAPSMNMDGRGAPSASLELNTDGPNSATPYINDEGFDIEFSLVGPNRTTFAGD